LGKRSFFGRSEEKICFFINFSFFLFAKYYITPEEQQKTAKNLTKKNGKKIRKILFFKNEKLSNQNLCDWRVGGVSARYVPFLFGGSGKILNAAKQKKGKFFS
jgi:hypothetical protein